METMGIWTTLKILRKRLWVPLLLLALTMGVILYRAWTTPPVYRSSIVLQVIPLEPEEVTLFTRLNTVSSADTIDLILYQFDSLVRNPRIAQRVLADTGVRMSAADVVSQMTVERDPAGDLLTVSVGAGTPADAEQLAVRLVDVALEEFRQSRARPSEASGKFLETELAAAEQELANAREALLKFKLDNGIEYLDRALATQQESVRSLTSAREAALIEAKRLDAVVGALEKQAEDARSRATAAAANTVDATYWQRAAQDATSAAISRSAEAAGKRAEAEATGALLVREQTNLASLIVLSREHQALDDAVQERQDSRDFLAGKFREARLKENQSRMIGYLQPVGAPSTPQSRIPGRTVQTAVLGGVLSFVLGIVIALALEFFQQALTRSRKVSAAAGENLGPSYKG